MFKLLKLAIPNGKKPVYLLKDENGRTPFSEFRDEIISEGNYETQLDQIDAWIHNRSCGDPIPPSKFKPLDGRKANDRVKDFEYKTKMLRVYSFEYDGGEVIWNGEKKDPNRQDRTIARMRGIKKRFCDQVRNSGSVTIEEEQHD